jgi:hypothetical protein
MQALRSRKRPRHLRQILPRHSRARQRHRTIQRPRRRHLPHRQRRSRCHLRLRQMRTFRGSPRPQPLRRWWILRRHRSRALPPHRRVQRPRRRHLPRHQRRQRCHRLRPRQTQTFRSSLRPQPLRRWRILRRHHSKALLQHRRRAPTTHLPQALRPPLRHPPMPPHQHLRRRTRPPRCRRHPLLRRTLR